MPSDLDFISRPNPVEPSALSSGNLSSHQLDRNTSEHLMPFLLNTRLSQQRRDGPTEVSKSIRHPNQTSGLPISDVLNKDEGTERTPPRPDQTFYTLPKLPVKRGTKRHRVPPVLQGLHEPPPTARILPSISAEETQVLLPSTRRTLTNENSFSEKDVQSISFTDSVISETSQTEGKSSSGKRVLHRNKWTDQETDDLLSGVVRFGIGSWKKILMCPDYKFNKRTTVDLKDRFRVCKPNAYGRPRTKKAKQAQEARAAKAAAVESSSLDCTTHSPETETTPTRGAIVVTFSDAEDDAALWKIQRRKRRIFTAEEDDALLRGYEEHGSSWQAIQKDPIFGASGRTTTDLRDRFRTRFPERYAKSGLAPRPTNFPKPARRSGAAGDDKQDSTGPTDTATVVSEVSKPPQAPPVNQTPQSAPSWQGPGLSSIAHRHHVLPLPRIVDDFLPELGFPDADDEGDGPITLDRSIVDWANNTMPSVRNVAPNTEGVILPGIDPLITLNLPKPGVF